MGASITSQQVNKKYESLSEKQTRSGYWRQPGYRSGHRQALASEGAHVALTYNSSPDRASEVAKAAQALGVQSLNIRADSADASAVIAAVERTVAELGGIDILVNNAGVATMGPIDDFKLEDFDRTLAVNVRAVFVGTQAAIKWHCHGTAPARKSRGWLLSWRVPKQVTSQVRA